MADDSVAPVTEPSPAPDSVRSPPPPSSEARAAALSAPAAFAFSAPGVSNTAGAGVQDDGTVGAERALAADVVELEDCQLPLASVVRAAKAGLPAGCSLTSDAKDALLRATTVFIMYLASAANDVRQESKRKTLLPSDVMAALEDVDLDDLAKTVQECAEAHNIRL